MTLASSSRGLSRRNGVGMTASGMQAGCQKAFRNNHGLQCGFCTPGFLMLAASTLEKNPDIGDEELLDVLSSNLCRCTGYQNIIKAVRAAQAEMRPKVAAE